MRGVYTEDSSICLAALHAGAAPAAGGSVTLKPTAGCSTYPGTTSNGVVSSPRPTPAPGFYFPKTGAGTCAVF
ncbi:MAG: LCCL domain-containing protein [Polyangiaceae bacterium]